MRQNQSHLVVSTGRAFKIDMPPHELARELLSETSRIEDLAVVREAASDLPQTPVWPSILASDSVAEHYSHLQRAALAEPGPIILVLWQDEWSLAFATEEQLQNSGNTYAFAFINPSSLLLGPTVKGTNDVYRSLWERRFAAAPSQQLFTIEHEPPHIGRIAPARLDLDLALAAAQVAAVDHSTRYVTYDLLSGETDVRPFIESAHRATTNTQPATSLDLEEIFVDRLAGIVTRIEDIEFNTPLGADIKVAQAWSADYRRLGLGDTSVVNGGAAPKSTALARQVAVGESLERYCANYIDQKNLIHSTQQDLLDAGEKVIEWDSIALFTDEQYQDPKFPYARVHEATSCAYTRVSSLDPDGQDTLAPASLVYLNWGHASAPDATTHHPINFVGVSAGSSYESALTNALEECIERDTMMLHWLQGTKHPQICDLPETLQAPVSLAQESGYEVWFLAIFNEFNIPVVAAVIDLPDPGQIAVGYACRGTWAEAMWKAWTEAVGLQESMTDIQRPSGMVWTSKETRLSKIGLRPQRSDRRYSQSYEPDFSDVTGLFPQLQLNLDPGIRSQTRKILLPSGVADINITAGNPRDWAIYRDAIVRTGHEVYVKDLTTPDIANEGVTVLRAITPGLLMNFPTAYPPLGAKRLLLPKGETSINYLPLPYA